MRAESLEPKSLVTSSKLRTDSDRVCTCVLERVRVQRLRRLERREGEEDCGLQVNLEFSNADRILAQFVDRVGEPSTQESKALKLSARGYSRLAV